MIDRDDFEARLHAWLDGELAPEEAAEMEAHCRRHADCGDLAASEKEFDERVRRALLSDARGRELVAEALRSARAGAGRADLGTGGPSEPDGGVPADPPFEVFVPRLRAATLAAAAVAALAAVTGAVWFQSMSPSECSYFVALEEAAEAPAHATEFVDGHECECVPIAYGDACHADRTQIDLPGGAGPALLMFSPLPGHTPAPELRRSDPGFDVWCGTANGRNLAAFEDPFGRGLWCVVGAQDEATLVAAVRRERDRMVSEPAADARPEHPDQFTR